MQDISRKFAAAPVLSAEEETRLLRAWRIDAEHAARDRLLLTHGRLAVKQARLQASRRPHLYEDMLQAGLRGLLNAIDTFEEAGGARLSTWSFWSIKEAIQQEMAVHMGVASVPKNLRIAAVAGSRKRRPDARAWAAMSGYVPFGVRSDGEEGGGIEETLASPEPNAEAIVIEVEEKERAVSAVASGLRALKPREREVLLLRQLSEVTETLEEIGRRMGISKERVRQIEVAAVAKLKARIVAEGNGIYA